MEWLAPAGAQDRAALAEWAMAHGVRLVQPDAEHAAELHVDLETADRVENELDRAREAMSAHEADGAERALARAEASLRASPELPQAAWLMAEVERAWAARWLRLEPRDPERAARAWQRAAGLDGGRVAGIGEHDAAIVAPVKATLVIEAHGDFEARLDGVEVHPGSIVSAEGEHALVVSQGGAPRFAAWVAIAADTTVRVGLGGPPTCSTDDVGRAHIVEDNVRADGVRCARWIAALPAGAAGSLRIATCEGARCGPLVAWRVEVAISPTASQPRAEPPKKKLPTWATIALLGAGVVATATVAILVSDAVKKPDPETRFVNGGVKVQHAGF